MNSPQSPQDDPLARFVFDYDPAVQRCARSWVRDQDLAQDLAQEAWLTVIKRYRPGQELRPAYVYQALRWALGSHFRAVAREREEFERFSRLDGDRVIEDFGVVIADRDHIKWLIERLGDRHIEILYLTEVERMNSTEIGEMLGMKPSTVRTYRKSISKRAAEYRLKIQEGAPDGR